MLKEEAEWIQENIDKLQIEGYELYPFGNVGCSDVKQDDFQPWVAKLINSIRSNGTLLNIDIKDSEGVDLVGNLLDTSFIEKLKKEQFTCFLCANILTNIRDKEQFSQSILKVLPVGGILIVSVSNRYPYVADPVDTLYRPNLEELKELYPNTEIIASALIESSSYAQLLWRKKKTMLVTILRMFVPFYKFKTWKNLVSYLPKTFKPVRSSCLILKKTDGAL